MTKLELPARLEHLEELLDFVEGEAYKAQFSTDRVSEIRLAAEEVLVNIFSYAYPEGDGRVIVSCGHEQDTFLLTIRDGGVPFNMLKAQDPDVSSGLSERHLGGLGIFFAKKMADETRYVRTEEENRLTFWFKKDHRKI